jgi:hypothetical protein
VHSAQLKVRKRAVMPQGCRHHWQAIINNSCAKGCQWDSCTTIKTTIKKQASNSHSQKSQERRQGTDFFFRKPSGGHTTRALALQASYPYVQQAPAVLANNGTQHCG